MTKYNKYCSVFGHAKIVNTEELREKLKLIFVKMIVGKDVRNFYFGGLGEFDELCWEIITELKLQFNDIKRIFCLSDPRYKNPSKRPRWINTDDYEEIIYFDLDFDYWYTRIYYRNCEIINRSDFVVFYVEHSEQSGAYKMMKYAIKNKKRIINICNMDKTINL